MIKRLLFVLGILVCSGSAFAQWSSDSTVNTPVCTALGSQQNPQACADNANGIIIVWEDLRNGNFDIYAQKLNSNGVPQWTINGVNICNSLAAQTAPVICTDGGGGAYVAWKDTRTAANGTDIFAQHINSDGSLAYGASGAGVAITKDVGPPDNLTICSDGNGNAFVAWQDSRSSISPSSTRPDIWMNKLTGGGVAWGDQGVGVISQTLQQTSPKIVSDGTGGCFLVWVNGGLPAASIWANRINANGSPQWASPGVQVFGVTSGSLNASKDPQVARDGSQLCVTWEQNNTDNTVKGLNILANRIKSDGTLLWGNSTAGSEISTDWAGDQINAVVFPDDSVDASGNGGLLVVYENYISSRDIVMTRLMPDGISLKPAVPNQLFGVCNMTGDQSAPKAVKTANSEVLIVWNDNRNSVNSTPYSSIYAQRCDKTPKRLMGPLPSFSSWGVAVSNKVGGNADQVQLVSRTNGAIAVWRDGRNATTDIYAQLIFKDGSLPIELSNFSLRSSEVGKVIVDWQTASEKDNAGFEIERRLISDASASNAYEIIGSYQNESTLRGAGSSNVERNYSFIDQPGKGGVYEYRLIDISLDGERITHEPKSIEVGKSILNVHSVGASQPNPFFDKTLIPLTLASDAIVSVEIYDVLGRVVVTPYHNVPMSAGTHQLTVNSTGLGVTGNYSCLVTVTDSRTGEPIYTNRQSLIVNR
ncbi:MAG: hypothetical protein WCH46_08930 [bacterium]